MQAVLCIVVCPCVILSLAAPSDMPPSALHPSALPLQFDYAPLHYAAMYGQVESLRLLLDRGADKEAKNEVC